jgi:hypothetical protein
MTATYIQALALGIDPAWRRLPYHQREADAADFANSIDHEPAVRTFTYSLIGLQAGTDLLQHGVVAAGDQSAPSAASACRPACPVCGGPLLEIRAKLQCSHCHTICETCCEGGRG